jgi:transcriptional regulator with GAF, ATPase, and Fis domain
MRPDINGFETCRRLKADEATRDIPVIFLTGLAQVEAAVKEFEAGVVDYMIKPVQVPELLAKVKTHLALQNLQQTLKVETTQRQAAELQLRQRNRELLLLSRIGQLVGSALDLDEVLKTILMEIRLLLDAPAASIWFVEEKGELLCRIADGAGYEAITGQRIQIGEGVAGWVAQHQSPAVVADVLQDSRFRRLGDRRIMLMIQSQLSLPIMIKDEVRAVLNVLDTEANRFSQADITLLEPILAMAAAAIENARLDTALRQQHV